MVSTNSVILSQVNDLPCIWNIDCEIGSIGIRMVDLSTDRDMIHQWLIDSHAKYWGMTSYTVAQTTAYFQSIAKSSSKNAYIGVINGTPRFLVETYDPAQDEIGRYIDAEPGDRGMHFLVERPRIKVHGLTHAVLRAILAFMFSKEEAKRIIVEPDVRNIAVQRLNEMVGFRPLAVVHLSTKFALLSVCKRDSNTDMELALPFSREALVHAQRFLLAKAIGEFTHEGLLAPFVEEKYSNGDELCTLTAGIDKYKFRCRRYKLDHWAVDPLSMECFDANGMGIELSIIRFVLQAGEQLGLVEPVMSQYISELNSTLFAMTYKFASHQLSADDVVQADFQTVEREMTGGHPVFVANSGRIGFGIDDYYKFAPECPTSINLFWIAVHRDYASFSCLSTMKYERFLSDELGEKTYLLFQEYLKRQNLQEDQYLFMPVHPWQWKNKLSTLFADDIGAMRIVPLGHSDDVYAAQQSIRTLFNKSTPQRSYVKVALSILNMGFVRGLSAKYMKATPAINEWIHTLISSDIFLRSCGLKILKEIASVGYESPSYPPEDSPFGAFHKMTSSLWRESPIPLVPSDKNLMTMACLLHLDLRGKSVVGALIRASGLSASSWLERYLQVYLIPLLHCFYKYELVFMPHGENIILVLNNFVPIGVFLKDIAEESAIMDPEIVLPETVKRLFADVPKDKKILSILTDIFDCFFRFLAPILDGEGIMTEDDFWDTVARTILNYQSAHPELSSQFQKYNIFQKNFSKSCLNRLQLKNNMQMVNLADPAGSLQIFGILENPIFDNSLKIQTSI